jgi:hypothetical protein
VKWIPEILTGSTLEKRKYRDTTDYECFNSYVKKKTGEKCRTNSVSLQVFKLITKLRTGEATET